MEKTIKYIVIKDYDYSDADSRAREILYRFSSMRDLTSFLDRTPIDKIDLYTIYEIANELEFSRVTVKVKKKANGGDKNGKTL